MFLTARIEYTNGRIGILNFTPESWRAWYADQQSNITDVLFTKAQW